jgi:Domain of unknown function (DUF3504)
VSNLWCSGGLNVVIVDAGLLVCRIEEEHLWESKQLGAHSPHVLLNTLIYFNTKYFMLRTPTEHLNLSFSHIMKHWKKTSSPSGKQGRSVYLRYYSPAQSSKLIWLIFKKKHHFSNVEFIIPGFFCQVPTFIFVPNRLISQCTWLSFMIVFILSLHHAYSIVDFVPETAVIQSISTVLNVFFWSSVCLHNSAMLTEVLPPK